MLNTTIKIFAILFFFQILNSKTTAQVINYRIQANLTNSNSILNTSCKPILSINNLKFNYSDKHQVNLYMADFSYELGSAIIAASIFTTIFVAPLVSTNLKNGDVNNPRLYKWIGVGLAGLAVGIPITLLSKGDSKKLTKYRNR
ncbi:MAG: hypothetical protein WCK02_00105 [Bacteroidota bacterium]